MIFEQRVLFQGKGTVNLGEEVTLGYSIGGSPRLPVLFQPRESTANIKIGNRTTIANGTEIIARRSTVTIDAQCLIGARCIILDADFHGLRPDERRSGGGVEAVNIGDNVWLGMGAVILKGVSIGENAVVGTGCIVTKNIPAGAIAVGSPMRIVGSVYDK